MAELVIRESSDMGAESSDAELSDYRKEDMEFARKMIDSNSKVDQRLLYFYKLTKTY